VQEPSIEDTIAILRGIKEKYEVIVAWVDGVFRLAPVYPI
ncbi:unnamed protein product, partial [marine sediment metagenome]